MISFSKTEEIEKILRQVLITQAELEPDKVLNSLSAYGTDLDQLLEDSIYVSIDKPDTILLYELKSRDSSSNVSMTIQEDIEYDKAYKLYVIMYGQSSTDVATKLVARLRTEEIRQQLYDSGVYLESVSDPDTINEYKNETMWLRNDVTINIAVKYAIKPITSDTTYENINFNII